GGRIALPSTQPGAQAVLLAPVADELADANLSHLGGESARGAILQGWLRDVDPDGTVRPRRLGRLAASLTQALRRFDLLIASCEDLEANGATPDEQLDATRRTMGPRPVLVLTEGRAGAWVDVNGERGHLPVPHVVEGVSSVGAGDILAALLLSDGSLRPATAADLRSRVELAMRGVADLLAE